MEKINTKEVGNSKELKYSDAHLREKTAEEARVAAENTGTEKDINEDARGYERDA